MTENLLRLMHMADPSLPIGGFAHSGGLETYVQENRVCDQASAIEWINGMLSGNFHFTDGYFASFSYDLASKNDFQSLAGLDDECTALKFPAEMRRASQKLGVRFLKNFQNQLRHASADQYLECITSHKLHGHYCLAFGICAAIFGIDKKAALTGFYYNAAWGFVVNSVKLIPLGQQQGQEILFSLYPIINSLVEDALNPRKERLGWCCPGFDIRSMQHESLYTRLYMS